MTTAPPSEEIATSPSEPRLEAKLDSKWALAPSHLTLIFLWILLYLLLSYAPLRGTDLWGHVMYGRQILEQRALPSADPFLPLAQGMPVVDGAWLSQVIFAWVEQRGGAEWLSCLFALTGLCTYLILARTYFLQSRRPWVMMLSMIGVVAVGWSRLLTIRPEIFAALCFATLLWLIVSSHASEQAPQESAESASSGATARRNRPWRMWLGVPLVFLLWANLHGSFACGVAVLGCFFLGRVIEIGWKTLDWRAVVDDRDVRRWLLWTELAVVATLINPYGVDLWLNTLVFAGNENLRTVLEWQPLVILGVGGVEFALSWVVLTVVLRHSRQRMPMAHVLLLGLFALAVVFGVRMLTWYAMVFGLVMTPHFRDLAARWFPVSEDETSAAGARVAAGGVIPARLSDEPLTNTGEEGEPLEEEEEGESLLPAGRAWSYSLIALLLIWIAFMTSPTSYAVMGRKTPRSAATIYGKETPLALTEYLRENPPTGQIYNPQWWGDWLVYDGPQGIQPFVTSNIHLVPRQVWRDYLSVLAAQADWRTILSKYAVNTVVLDRSQQENLVSLLRRQQDWRMAYSDDQAMVFTRTRAPGTNVSESSSGLEDAPGLERPVEAPESESKAATPMEPSAERKTSLDTPSNERTNSP